MDEVGDTMDDAVDDAITDDDDAAPRRSGRANRCVSGSRLGFEHEAFFAAASVPVPQTQDGSDIEGMSEPFK
jgi:hypothetical protein